LLHLSDVHLDGMEVQHNRIPAIARAVASLQSQAKACVTVVSGDLAFSGRREQYEEALSFMSELETELSSVTDSELHWVVIPGNHDCDFDLDTQARQLLLAHIRGAALERVDNSTATQFTSVQQPFFSFLDGVQTRLTEGHSPTLTWDIRLDVCGKVIAFHCLNTAWMSELEERQGALLFPVGNIPDHRDGADLDIAVIHHPFNWLDFRNARTLSEHTRSIADLILTGHEHRADAYEIRRPGEPTKTYLAGAVFYDPLEPCAEEQAFQVVEVDLDSSSRRVTLFTWSDDDAHFCSSETEDWIEYSRDPSLGANSFPFKGEFESYLSDLGAGITHPNVDDLLLQDIFVLPDIAVSVSSKRKESDHAAIVEGHDVLARLIESRKALLTGPDRSGKTCLLKRVVLDYHDRGLVPILISGRSISSADRQGFISLIDEQFLQDYEATDSDLFWQLPPDARALIVDDLDLSALNRDGRDRVLESALSMFSYVIVAGNETLQLDEVIDGSDGGLLWAFSQFGLLEFGRRLREQLIRRWLLLGREWTISDADLVHEIAECGTLVDTLLGKHLIPAYPIIVLSILQGRESAAPLSTASGALGYYYELLITTALEEAMPSLDLDTKYTYLSELANQMYDSGSRDLERERFRSFNETHQATYKLTIDYSALEAGLLKARILQERGNGLRFRYSYIYYYFLARFTRDGLHDPGSADHMQTRIRAMSRNVHREVNANALIFLCYLSRDPFILDEMLAMSKRILSDHDPCDLDKDVKALAFLQSEEPQVVLSGHRTDEEREQHLRELDRVDRSQVTTHDPVAERDEIDSELLSINAALKSIQILGQVLRNFPGSIPADRKVGIAEECYSLGLRTMTMILRAIGASLPDLLEFVQERLREVTDQADEEKLARIAERILFFVTEGVSYSLIKTVSRSAGSEQLSATYEDLLQQCGTTAVGIINIAIKLDHYKRIPQREIGRMYDEVKDNVFTSTILRHLVVEHLRLFPVSHSVRQRLCARLKIAFKLPALPRGKESGTD